MIEQTDSSLVLRVRSGDVEAYGELVHRHQASVFSTCFRLLGERREAEDLAQEAFIRAYRRLNLYDPTRPLRPWLCRIAANLCFNRLQQLTPEPVALDDDLHPAPASLLPEASQEKTERRSEILSAILALPPLDRAVIELRHYQDLSYAEIAAALQLSIAEVKTRLFRSRKSLARRLSPDAP